MVHRRSTSDVPPIYGGGRNEEFTDTHPGKHSPRRIDQVVVDSAERADRITVADHVDGNPVSAFVSETDFEAETLFLQTTRVEACFRLRLCNVSWAPNDVHTDYARWLRPYDERCEADEYVYESRLMRLPAALDADEVNSYGSTIGGVGSCDGPGPAGRNQGSDDEASGKMPTGTPEGTPTGTLEGTPTGTPAETTSESADGGDER
jgi:hypothetical protein